MLENEDALPDFVRNSHKYKKKKEEFILQYCNSLFESSSSQDLASSYSQLPEFVRESKAFKTKMSKRTQQQLSNWRILKNVNDTLKELQKNKSEVAYNQRVQLVAAVFCPRYGVPAVEETRSMIEAGKVMRRKLFTGTEHILKGEAKKEKEYIPQEVHKMAEDSWLNKSTIPKQAKHLRPHCIKKIMVTQYLDLFR